MRRRALLVVLGVVAVVAGLSVGTRLLGGDDRVRVPDSATAAEAPGPARIPSSTNAGKVSPYVLRPVAGELPVEVDFENEPAAGILFDVDTGEVLWEHDSGEQLPIASLTKMMTALLITKGHGPGEDVPITPEALAYEGSGMGVLPKGKEVELEALLKGLILVSGNDAAIALAQHDAGSVDAFVEEMNRARARYGLACTHFTSPHGLQGAARRDPLQRRHRAGPLGARPRPPVADREPDEDDDRAHHRPPPRSSRHAGRTSSRSAGTCAWRRCSTGCCCRPATTPRWRWPNTSPTA